MIKMRNELSKLTIDTVARGAAAELFDHAMAEVVENILDENRSPGETRKITLTFDIKPNKDLSAANINVQVKTSLAPVVKTESVMFIRKERGKAKAYAHNFDENEMFDEEGNVKSIADKKAK